VPQYESNSIPFGALRQTCRQGARQAEPSDPYLRRRAERHRPCQPAGVFM